MVGLLWLIQTEDVSTQTHSVPKVRFVYFEPSHMHLGIYDQVKLNRLKTDTSNLHLHEISIFDQ